MSDLTDFIAGLSLAIDSGGGFVSPSSIRDKLISTGKLSSLEMRTFAILNTTIYTDVDPTHYVAWWPGGVFTVAEIDGDGMSLVGWELYTKLEQTEEEIIESFNRVMIKASGHD